MIRRITYTLLAMLVLLLTALNWLLTSASGLRYLESQIHQRALGDFQIHLVGLQGNLLSQFGFEQLRLYDREGLWLEAGETDFEWRPQALLTRTLDAPHVYLSKLTVLRPPKASPSETAAQSTDEGELQLNWQIELGNLTVDALSLPAQWAGQEPWSCRHRPPPT